MSILTANSRKQKWVGFYYINNPEVQWLWVYADEFEKLHPNIDLF